MLHVSNCINLDIERMYGQRKPIAQRIPLIPLAPTTRTMFSGPLRLRPLTSQLYVESSSTPAATEGETTETETELETELDDSYMSSGSNLASVHENRTRSHALTQHDLMNFFFRKDVIILRNVDLLRYA
jgi:phosphatidylethanolamine N-methyltransferase